MLKVNYTLENGFIEFLPGELPTYKGWTVDIRCKEFRKMDTMQFERFNSEIGDQLLCELLDKDLIPDDLIGSCI